MGYKRAFDLHLALAGRQVERGAQIVVLAVHRGAALGQQPDLLRVALILSLIHISEPTRPEPI
eukprot:900370-Pyramimonas_sp.AAC.1